jgi:hypothetical protein
MRGLRRLITVLALAAVAGSVQQGLGAAGTKYCPSPAWFESVICYSWCGGQHPALAFCVPCGAYYCECQSGQWFAGIDPCVD